MSAVFHFVLPVKRLRHKTVVKTAAINQSDVLLTTDEHRNNEEIEKSKTRLCRCLDKQYCMSISWLMGGKECNTIAIAKIEFQNTKPEAVVQYHTVVGHNNKDIEKSKRPSSNVSREVISSKIYPSNFEPHHPSFWGENLHKVQRKEAEQWHQKIIYSYFYS